MKYSYPVVYALIPIYRDGTWYKDEDFRNDIIYYMISKCYLYEEKTIYKSDGTKINHYKVVLPFVSVHQGNDYFKRIYNIESESDGYISVDYISKSYKDICKYKEKKESEFVFTMHRHYSNTFFGKEFYSNLISRYEEIEKLFEENLKDLDLSKNIGGRLINKEYESDDTYYVYINDEKVRKRVSSSEQRKGIKDITIYI